MNSTQQVPTLPVLQDELEDTTIADIDDIAMSDIDDSEDHSWTQPQHYQRRSCHDGSSEEESDQSSDTLQLPSVTPSPPSRPATAAISDTADVSRGTAQAANPVVEELTPMRPDSQTRLPEDDLITDTVGAIAIDSYGNIACGASSGGIGMKYRGRVGPAALVGVGAAVVPADPDDKARTTVASVASGTGEHMATTMAATVCAERVYYGVKKARGGGYESVEDDYALRAMIEQDFMGKRTFGISVAGYRLTRTSAGHPSVKKSRSAGAIGVLCVKKTREGAYLYFAHNTDSFVSTPILFLSPTC